MFFKDSCVSKISDFSVFEESTAIPANIFPVYIGTGNTVMSIDASGLQGLNNRVQRPFGSLGDGGDMYVVSHGMVSDVITEDNAHPYGYFTWEMFFWDNIIDHSNLEDVGGVWKRKLYLDQGRVVTSMILMRSIKLELDVTAPLGSDAVVIKVRIKAHDNSGQRRNVNIPLKFKINLNMKTRQGVPTYEGFDFKDNTVSVSYKGAEDYNYKISTISDGISEFENGVLSVLCDMTLTDDFTETAVVYNFSDKETGDISDLLINNIISRKEKFAALASFSGLDEVSSYLYNNNLYLLMSCCESKKGFPIGFPFFFPFCWKCSNFWDTTFVMDGLMRIGSKQDADNFIEFLFKNMNDEGAPFPWMFIYNGKATHPSDMAPLVMCAHAMTAIRYYEYFNDAERFIAYCYPIIKRVCDFFLQNMFSKNEAGKWILSVPVSNDVVDEKAVEINQTHTLLWCLTIIKKCCEYEKLFFDTENMLYGDVVENYYIESDENEYYHSKDIKASEHHCASWIPFLLFPTEAMPFVDMDLLEKTRKKYSWDELYMDKQGCYQPWTELIQAVSDIRLGDNEEAYRLFKLALSHTFGVGYFSEIGPQQETVGLPPYISATGSFLNFITSYYIGTDIWDGHLEVFTAVSNEDYGKKLSFNNVVCTGDIVASGYMDRGRFGLSLISQKPCGLSIKCKMPKDIDADDLQVLVNYKNHDFELVDRRKRIIKIDVDFEDELFVELI